MLKQKREKSIMIHMKETEDKKKAYFHLPGLFEFYDFYKIFLPLYQKHREYFYEWAEIGSIYGAPGECIWGGGRVGYGENDPAKVQNLMKQYHISARLTFSNSLLRKEHLSDPLCNELCAGFEDEKNGIIITSDLLLHYIQTHYPEYYFVSSTTKVLTAFSDLQKELDRKDFAFVVPDFRLNKNEQLFSLPQAEKDKIEFLVNECCWFGCTERKRCYEAVSRLALGEGKDDHICPSPDAKEGYLFSKAMENPGFISKDEIVNTYMPAGFSNFKIEGRSLGSASLLEFLLYYMTKPQYQIHVREKIYLSNTLDLF